MWLFTDLEPHVLRLIIFILLFGPSSDALLIGYVFTGCAPPLHSGVYVSGHFNGLAAVAFLPPPRSPAKSMREPRFPPLLSH